MVLLVERLTKLYSKLDNHHHHHHHHQQEALDASLEGFRSDVSSFLERLSLNPKPGSEILSLAWFQQCLELIHSINRAFAKLVVEIDYPVTKWETKSAEEYFNYSFNLLNLMNSISSCLSHLGQSRLSLSHGLSIVEDSPSTTLKHLKPIKLKRLIKDSEVKYDKESTEGSSSSGKEGIIQQGLKEMESIGYWVCGIVLAGLSGDSDQYLTRKKSREDRQFYANRMDASVSEFMEKGRLLNEVKELNDAADRLVSAITTEGECRNAVEELQKRLEEFEKLLDGLGKEVDCLFNEVLAGRNQMLNGIRRQQRQ
ncbi:hypothetical protein HS088_TW01G00561 [Tripterygium wilfordii]|uniref:Uncharacterized protein n=1 Tax=Tripterygium wilfordii TaxID=458696 RepID=A0A7J7E2V8_TRIWF|nr:protein BPS1, chloroplastic-like [Tripterygium wilfordii]KAF5752646.1 hypothetical protein HS088_TW01G00561 [Tripterygium wilfordii]